MGQIKFLCLKVISMSVFNSYIFVIKNLNSLSKLDGRLFCAFICTKHKIPSLLSVSFKVSNNAKRIILNIVGQICTVNKCLATTH